MSPSPSLFATRLKLSTNAEMKRLLHKSIATRTHSKKYAAAIGEWLYTGCTSTPTTSMVSSIMSCQLSPVAMMNTDKNASGKLSKLNFAFRQTPPAAMHSALVVTLIDVSVHLCILPRNNSMPNTLSMASMATPIAQTLPTAGILLIIASTTILNPFTR